jgi:hypothetical protein
MSELEQNRTKELMPLKYFDAIRMRFGGYTYAEISKKVDLKEGYLRQLFCKGGVLHDTYQDYAEKEREYRQEHTKEIFNAHVESVARRFVQIVNTGKEMSAIIAGKEILDRTIGKVQDKIEHTGSVGIAVVDVLKAIEKIENENRSNRKNIEGES